MPRGLLLSRLQSSWNWVQTLALCPSYRRTSASSACYINVRLVWGEKWLCWCGFPGDGAWSLLNLALIAECVLCLSCICQHVHTHTQGDMLTIQWLKEIRWAFLERQERLCLLLILFSLQFWPFLPASPCGPPPSLLPPSKNEMCNISFYGPSTS